MTKTLDIYPFLMPDTAAHCRKIGHTFSPLDMAVIVAYSRKTVKERMDAWQAIVDTCPDMPTTGNSTFEPRNSLHEYLRQSITWHEGWIDGFYAHSPAFVFVPHIREKEGDWRDYNLGCYSTLQMALDSARKHTAKYTEGEQIPEVVVVKEEIDKEDGGDYEELHALFDLNGDLLEIYSHPPEHINDLRYVFIDLPVPFENGDILSDGDGAPLVVMCLPHTGEHYKEAVLGEWCDGGDLCALAYGFEKERDGSARLTHSHPSLHHLRFYKKELQGQERFLKDFGQHIKETGDRSGDVVWLINSYNKLKAEADAANFQPIF